MKLEKGMKVEYQGYPFQVIVPRHPWGPEGGITVVLWNGFQKNEVFVEDEGIPPFNILERTWKWPGGEITGRTKAEAAYNLAQAGHEFTVFHEMEEDESYLFHVKSTKGN